MQSAIRSLVSLSFISGAALFLCPEGGIRQILRILCAALFASAILTPLGGFHYEVMSQEEARFERAAAEISMKADTAEDRLKQMILRENCERYIVDRGQEHGLKITKAEVELKPDEGGQWLPYKVTVEALGEKTEAEEFRALIYEELGIPMERQVWSLIE